MDGSCPRSPIADTISRDLHRFHHAITIMPHARANGETARLSRLRPCGVWSRRSVGEPTFLCLDLTRHAEKRCGIRSRNITDLHHGLNLAAGRRYVQVDGSTSGVGPSLRRRPAFERPKVPRADHHRRLYARSTSRPTSFCSPASQFRGSFRTRFCRATSRACGQRSSWLPPGHSAYKKPTPSGGQPKRACRTMREQRFCCVRGDCLQSTSRNSEEWEGSER